MLFDYFFLLQFIGGQVNLYIKNVYNNSIRTISNGTIIICFGLFFFVGLLFMACNIDGNLHIVPSR
jgi:hypothetical protein